MFLNLTCRSQILYACQLVAPVMVIIPVEL